MSGLGEILRNAREEKGISLEELEAMTKIRKRYLTAIEEQDYEVLPGSFYVRAFIKNYAETVGLNPNDILELYKNELPEKSAPSSIDSLPQTRKGRSSFNFEKWGKWASALIMVSFFLLIIALIYYYMIHNDTPESRVADETPILSGSEVVGNTNGGPQQDVDDGEQDDHTTNDNENELSGNEQPDPDSDLEDELPKPEVVLTNAQGSTDVYTVTALELLEVTVEVTDQLCWVTVKEEHVNGNVLYNAMMSSGENDSNDQIQTWTSDRSLYIVLGRASDVTVTVNGIELDPFEIATVRNLQLNFVHADEGHDENI